MAIFTHFQSTMQKLKSITFGKLRASILKKLTKMIFSETLNYFKKSQFLTDFPFL